MNVYLQEADLSRYGFDWFIGVALALVFKKKKKSKLGKKEVDQNLSVSFLYICDPLSSDCWYWQHK